MEEVEADIPDLSYILNLTQEEKEHLACLDMKEALGWFSEWFKDKISYEVADKFPYDGDLFKRTRANPKAADYTDAQIKWGQLAANVAYSELLLIEFLWKAKNDFLKHIGEALNENEDGFAQMLKEVEEFYPNYIKDKQVSGFSEIMEEKTYWKVVATLEEPCNEPIILWLLHESMGFLIELWGKKFKGVTEEGEVSAFGERFIFKDRKLAEHISPTFDFSVEEWLKEHEAKETYADGKPTAEGLKIVAYRRYYQEHDKQKVIAHDLEISQPTVAQWVDQVEYKIGYNLGHAFEDFFARTRAPIMFKSYKKLGGNGEPDGIGELENGDIEVVSLKCYRENRNSVTIPRKELAPEIKETTKLVAEGKKARLHLFFREHLRGYEADRFVDVQKDEPETFSLPVKKEKGAD